MMDKQDKQEAFWKSIINKYEERNISLESELLCLQKRINQTDVAIPAVMTYHMAKLAQESTDCKDLASLYPPPCIGAETCPCMTNNPLPDMTNMTAFSIETADICYMEKIKELAGREKSLLEEVNSLRAKDNALQNTKTKIAELNFGPDEQMHVNAKKKDVGQMNDHLVTENQRLFDEVADLKLELKHLREDIEGPMFRELERERRKNVLMEAELRQKDYEDDEKGRDCELEIKILKSQLDASRTNLKDMQDVSVKMKEQFAFLTKRIEELQTELVNQKLSEASTLAALKAKMDTMRKKASSTSSCPSAGSSGDGFNDFADASEKQEPQPKVSLTPSDTKEKDKDPSRSPSPSSSRKSKDVDPVTKVRETTTGSMIRKEVTIALIDGLPIKEPVKSVPVADTDTEYQDALSRKSTEKRFSQKAVEKFSYVKQSLIEKGTCSPELYEIARELSKELELGRADKISDTVLQTVSDIKHLVDLIIQTSNKSVGMKSQTISIVQEETKVTVATSCLEMSSEESVESSYDDGDNSCICGESDVPSAMQNLSLADTDECICDIPGECENDSKNSEVKPRVQLVDQAINAIYDPVPTYRTGQSNLGESTCCCTVNLNSDPNLKPCPVSQHSHKFHVNACILAQQKSGAPNTIMKQHNDGENTTIVTSCPTIMKVVTQGPGGLIETRMFINDEGLIEVVTEVKESSEKDAKTLNLQGQSTAQSDEDTCGCNQARSGPTDPSSSGNDKNDQFKRKSGRDNVKMDEECFRSAGDRGKIDQLMEMLCRKPSTDAIHPNLPQGPIGDQGVIVAYVTEIETQSGHHAIDVPPPAMSTAVQVATGILPDSYYLVESEEVAEIESQRVQERISANCSRTMSTQCVSTRKHGGSKSNMVNKLTDSYHRDNIGNIEQVPNLNCNDTENNTGAAFNYLEYIYAPQQQACVFPVMAIPPEASKNDKPSQDMDKSSREVRFYESILCTGSDPFDSTPEYSYSSCDSSTCKFLQKDTDGSNSCDCTTSLQCPSNIFASLLFADNPVPRQANTDQSQGSFFIQKSQVIVAEIKESEAYTKCDDDGIEDKVRIKDEQIQPQNVPPLLVDKAVDNAQFQRKSARSAKSSKPRKRKQTTCPGASKKVASPKVCIMAQCQTSKVINPIEIANQNIPVARQNCPPDCPKTVPGAIIQKIANIGNMVKNYLTAGTCTELCHNQAIGAHFRVSCASTGDQTERTSNRASKCTHGDCHLTCFHPCSNKVPPCTCEATKKEPKISEMEQTEVITVVTSKTSSKVVSITTSQQYMDQDHYEVNEEEVTIVEDVIEVTSTTKINIKSGNETMPSVGLFNVEVVEVSSGPCPGAYNELTSVETGQSTDKNKVDRSVCTCCPRALGDEIARGTLTDETCADADCANIYTPMTPANATTIALETMPTECDKSTYTVRGGTGAVPTKTNVCTNSSRIIQSTQEVGTNPKSNVMDLILDKGLSCPPLKTMTDPTRFPMGAIKEGECHGPCMDFYRNFMYCLQIQQSRNLGMQCSGVASAYCNTQPKYDKECYSPGLMEKAQQAQCPPTAEHMTIVKSSEDAIDSSHYSSVKTTSMPTSEVLASTIAAVVLPHVPKVPSRTAKDRVDSQIRHAGVPDESLKTPMPSMRLSTSESKKLLQRITETGFTSNESNTKPISLPNRKEGTDEIANCKPDCPGTCNQSPSRVVQGNMDEILTNVIIKSIGTVTPLSMEMSPKIQQSVNTDAETVTASTSTVPTTQFATTVTETPPAVFPKRQSILMPASRSEGGRMSGRPSVRIEEIPQIAYPEMNAVISKSNSGKSSDTFSDLVENQLLGTDPLATAPSDSEMRPSLLFLPGFTYIKCDTGCVAPCARKPTYDDICSWKKCTAPCAFANPPEKKRSLQTDGPDKPEMHLSKIKSLSTAEQSAAMESSEANVVVLSCIPGCGCTSSTTQATQPVGKNNCDCKADRKESRSKVRDTQTCLSICPTKLAIIDGTSRDVSFKKTLPETYYPTEKEIAVIEPGSKRASSLKNLALETKSTYSKVCICAEVSSKESTTCNPEVLNSCSCGRVPYLQEMVVGPKPVGQHEVTREKITRDSETVAETIPMGSMTQSPNVRSMSMQCANSGQKLDTASSPIPIEQVPKQSQSSGGSTIIVKQVEVQAERVIVASKSIEVAAEKARTLHQSVGEHVTTSQSDKSCTFAPDNIHQQIDVAKSLNEVRDEGTEPDVTRKTPTNDVNTGLSKTEQPKNFGVQRVPSTKNAPVSPRDPYAAFSRSIQNVPKTRVAAINGMSMIVSVVGVDIGSQGPIQPKTTNIGFSPSARNDLSRNLPGSDLEDKDERHSRTRIECVGKSAKNEKSKIPCPTSRGLCVCPRTSQWSRKTRTVSSQYRPTVASKGINSSVPSLISPKTSNSQNKNNTTMITKTVGNYITTHIATVPIKGNLAKKEVTQHELFGMYGSTEQTIAIQNLTSQKSIKRSKITCVSKCNAKTSIRKGDCGCPAKTLKISSSSMSTRGSKGASGSRKGKPVCECPSLPNLIRMIRDKLKDAHEMYSSRANVKEQYCQGKDYSKVSADRDAIRGYRNPPLPKTSPNKYEIVPENISAALTSAEIRKCDDKHWEGIDTKAPLLKDETSRFCDDAISDSLLQGDSDPHLHGEECTCVDCLTTPCADGKRSGSDMIAIRCTCWKRGLCEKCKYLSNENRCPVHRTKKASCMCAKSMESTCDPHPAVLRYTHQSAAYALSGFAEPPNEEIEDKPVEDEAERLDSGSKIECTMNEPDAETNEATTRNDISPSENMIEERIGDGASTSDSAEQTIDNETPSTISEISEMALQDAGDGQDIDEDMNEEEFAITTNEEVIIDEALTEQEMCKLNCEICQTIEDESFEILDNFIEDTGTISSPADEEYSIVEDVLIAQEKCRLQCEICQSIEDESLVNGEQLIIEEYEDYYFRKYSKENQEVIIENPVTEQELCRLKCEICQTIEEESLEEAEENLIDEDEGGFASSTDDYYFRTSSKENLEEFMEQTLTEQELCRLKCEICQTIEDECLEIDEEIMIQTDEGIVPATVEDEYIDSYSNENQEATTEETLTEQEIYRFEGEIVTEDEGTMPSALDDKYIDTISSETLDEITGKVLTEQEMCTLKCEICQTIDDESWEMAGETITEEVMGTVLSYMEDNYIDISSKEKQEEVFEDALTEQEMCRLKCEICQTIDDESWEIAAEIIITEEKGTDIFEETLTEQETCRLKCEFCRSIEDETGEAAGETVIEEVMETVLSYMEEKFIDISTNEKQEEVFGDALTEQDMCRLKCEFCRTIEDESVETTGKTIIEEVMRTVLSYMEDKYIGRSSNESQEEIFEDALTEQEICLIKCEICQSIDNENLEIATEIIIKEDKGTVPLSMEDKYVGTTSTEDQDVITQTEQGEMIIKEDKGTVPLSYEDKYASTSSEETQIVLTEKTQTEQEKCALKCEICQTSADEILEGDKKVIIEKGIVSSFMEDKLICTSSKTNMEMNTEEVLTEQEICRLKCEICQTIDEESLPGVLEEITEEDEVMAPALETGEYISTSSKSDQPSKHDEVRLLTPSRMNSEEWREFLTDILILNIHVTPSESDDKVEISSGEISDTKELATQPIEDEITEQASIEQEICSEIDECVEITAQTIKEQDAGTVSSATIDQRSVVDTPKKSKESSRASIESKTIPDEASKDSLKIVDSAKYSNGSKTEEPSQPSMKVESDQESDSKDISPETSEASVTSTDSQKYVDSIKSTIISKRSSPVAVKTEGAQEFSTSKDMFREGSKTSTKTVSFPEIPSKYKESSPASMKEAFVKSDDFTEQQAAMKSKQSSGLVKIVEFDSEVQYKESTPASIEEEGVSQLGRERKSADQSLTSVTLGVVDYESSGTIEELIPTSDEQSQELASEGEVDELYLSKSESKQPSQASTIKEFSSIISSGVLEESQQDISSISTATTHTAESVTTSQDEEMKISEVLTEEIVEDDGEYFAAKESGESKEKILESIQSSLVEDIVSSGLLKEEQLKLSDDGEMSEEISSGRSKGSMLQEAIEIEYRGSNETTSESAISVQPTIEGSSIGPSEKSSETSYLPSAQESDSTAATVQSSISERSSQSETPRKGIADIQPSGMQLAGETSAYKPHESSRTSVQTESKSKLQSPASDKSIEFKIVKSRISSEISPGSTLSKSLNEFEEELIDVTTEEGISAGISGRSIRTPQPDSVTDKSVTDKSSEFKIDRSRIASQISPGTIQSRSLNEFEEELIDVTTEKGISAGTSGRSIRTPQPDSVSVISNANVQPEIANVDVDDEESQLGSFFEFVGEEEEIGDGDAGTFSDDVGIAHLAQQVAAIREREAIEDRRRAEADRPIISEHESVQESVQEQEDDMLVHLEQTPDEVTKSMDEEHATDVGKIKDDSTVPMAAEDVMGKSDYEAKTSRVRFDSTNDTIRRMTEETESEIEDRPKMVESTSEKELKVEILSPPRPSENNIPIQKTDILPSSPSTVCLAKHLDKKPQKWLICSCEGECKCKECRFPSAKERLEKFECDCEDPCECEKCDFGGRKEDGGVDKPKLEKVDKKEEKVRRSSTEVTTPKKISEYGEDEKDKGRSVIKTEAIPQEIGKDREDKKGKDGSISSTAILPKKVSEDKEDKKEKVTSSSIAVTPQKISEDGRKEKDKDKSVSKTASIPQETAKDSEEEKGKDGSIRSTAILPKGVSEDKKDKKEKVTSSSIEVTPQKISEDGRKDKGVSKTASIPQETAKDSEDEKGKDGSIRSTAILPKKVSEDEEDKKKKVTSSSTAVTIPQKISRDGQQEKDKGKSVSKTAAIPLETPKDRADEKVKSGLISRAESIPEEIPEDKEEIKDKGTSVSRTTTIPQEMDEDQEDKTKKSRSFKTTSPTTQDIGDYENDIKLDVHEDQSPEDEEFLQKVEIDVISEYAETDAIKSEGKKSLIVEISQPFLQSTIEVQKDVDDNVIYSKSQQVVAEEEEKECKCPPGTKRKKRVRDASIGCTCTPSDIERKKARRPKHHEVSAEKSHQVIQKVSTIQAEVPPIVSVEKERTTERELPSKDITQAVELEFPSKYILEKELSAETRLPSSHVVEREQSAEIELPSKDVVDMQPSATQELMDSEDFEKQRTPERELPSIIEKRRSDLAELPTEGFAEKQREPEYIFIICKMYQPEHKSIGDENKGGKKPQRHDDQLGKIEQANVADVPAFSKDIDKFDMERTITSAFQGEDEPLEKDEKGKKPMGQDDQPLVAELEVSTDAPQLKPDISKHREFVSVGKITPVPERADQISKEDGEGKEPIYRDDHSVISEEGRRGDVTKFKEDVSKQEDLAGEENLTTVFQPSDESKVEDDKEMASEVRDEHLHMGEQGRDTDVPLPNKDIGEQGEFASKGMITPVFQPKSESQIEYDKGMKSELLDDQQLRDNEERGTEVPTHPKDIGEQGELASEGKITPVFQYKDISKTEYDKAMKYELMDDKPFRGEQERDSDVTQHKDGVVDQGKLTSEGMITPVFETDDESNIEDDKVMKTDILDEQLTTEEQGRDTDVPQLKDDIGEQEELASKEKIYPGFKAEDELQVDDDSGMKPQLLADQQFVGELARDSDDPKVTKDIGEQLTMEANSTPEFQNVHESQVEYDKGTKLELMDDQQLRNKQEKGSEVPEGIEESIGGMGSSEGKIISVFQAEDQSIHDDDKGKKPKRPEVRSSKVDQDRVSDIPKRSEDVDGYGEFNRDGKVSQVPIDQTAKEERSVETRSLEKSKSQSEERVLSNIPVGKVHRSKEKEGIANSGQIMEEELRQSFMRRFEQIINDALKKYEMSPIYSGSRTSGSISPSGDTSFEGREPQKRKGREPHIKTPEREQQISADVGEELKSPLFDKQQLPEFKQRVKDLQNMVEQIKCSCEQVEAKVGPIFNKKQSEFRPNISSLQLALNILEKKCQVKDELIHVLKSELESSEPINFRQIKTDRKPSKDYNRSIFAEAFPPRGGIGELYVRDDCGCEEANTKGCECGKDETPLAISEVRRIGPTSLLIKWTSPSLRDILGFNIFVNGVLKAKIFSPQRRTSIIDSLDFSKSMEIKLMAVARPGMDTNLLAVANYTL